MQEDEEEEDLSSCSGREELTTSHNSLNRRGSRSEGRLNLALQERLTESERRKPEFANLPKREALPKMNILRNLNDERPKSAENNNANKWRMGKSSSIPETSSPTKPKFISEVKQNTNAAPTNIITEASTITIPILLASPYTPPVYSKYKTIPSPTRTSPIISSPLQLNEIFEEGDGAEAGSCSNHHFVSRNQKRTSYEQKRSKFHKNRTASCSSSDASDDDSESRKKRAHKLNNSDKPIRGRRDSHDDSSDSQEPGAGTSGGRNGQVGKTSIIREGDVQTTQNSNKTNNNNTNNNNNERKNAGNSGVMFGRRHKMGRRRTGETRLRESQSLNRITEVQEDPSHSVMISTTITATQGANTTMKVKGIGARILQVSRVLNYILLLFKLQVLKIIDRYLLLF